MSTGYQVLVMLHLLCVVGGFGALAYNGLYLFLARRRGPSASAALEVNAQISTLAELLIYAAVVFGIAAVGASHSVWKFSQGWVSAAFALAFVDIGVLHGWIKPHQRRFGSTAEQAQASDVAVLDGLEKRISLGWGAFNLIVIAIVYLMVFKPGT
jgi:uncharacterized membrane protein